MQADTKNQNWTVKNNKLTREFKFKDFKSTLEFVNKVGDVAEKFGHHPEIFFTWGKALISLTTHDQSDQITQKDTLLAKEIDLILN